jgi:DNA-directed RNA polymerase I, II, and III subunit RPABC2
MADAEDFEEYDDVQEELDVLEAPPDDPYNMLKRFHPETVIDYAETILPLIPIQVTAGGEKDPAHTSLPFLTVYEKTKVLGTRANQIATGARPFVVVPEHMTDPLEIAKLELEQRRLPYIIKRPMPDGTFEYWRLSDLMIL